MTTTILFDLDDTLLNNPMERFLPEYFRLLGNHLFEHYPPDKLPKLILQSTEKMVNNLDPEKTLEDCFDKNFYPHIQKTKQDLAATIKNFYDNVFPDLKPITKPIPGIPELISDLKKNKTNIVISTNPLFPIKAILHRLDWAGLSHQLNHFNLITAYEDFHFAKPHPEYIAETLAYIGWPDGLIVLIGNDWEMDILPAEKLGIPTYFLGIPPQHNQFSQHPLSDHGNHDGILTWINKIKNKTNTFECANHRDAFMAILRATPAALDTLLKPLSETKSKLKPIQDEWSITEIISHLFDVDNEVNIPRIKNIKNNNEPFFSAVITDEWAVSRNYQTYPFHEMLHKFIQARKTLLREIDSLNKEDWDKTITHTIFGPTSVLEIIKFMAQHDRIHIQQIFKTLSA